MKWLIGKIMRYLALQFLEALYQVADEMSALEKIPATVDRTRTQRSSIQLGKHD